jgi:hypothetical protein
MPENTFYNWWMKIAREENWHGNTEPSAGEKVPTPNMGPCA